MAILTLVLATLFGALATMGASQPELKDGAYLPSEMAFPLLLAGGERAGDSQTFVLKADGAQTVDVMTFSSPFPSGAVELCINGALTDSQPLVQENSVVRTTSLHVGDEQGVAVVTFTGIPADTRAFVDTGRTMRTVLGASSLMGSFETGLLFAVMVYAATLHAFKRSERYMLAFVLYVLVLVLQVSLFNHAWSSGTAGWLYYSASRFTMAATVVLSVSVCYRLAGVSVGGACSWALGWKGVACVSAAVALMACLFWEHVGLAIDSAVYGAGALAALYGCARCERRDFYIPATLLTSTLACGCGATLSFLNLSQGFLYCALLTTPPLFSIPFVLVAMVAVNRRFAGKFREAENLNAALDRLVLERTRSLHEQEAQRKQLMINVFHDLRSPLFVLKDLAAFSRENPETARRNAPLIEERVDFLARLTNDLFYLAKLEEGKVLFSEDLFDAGELARQSAEAWVAPAMKSGVTVEIGATEDCTVVGDDMRLKEAVDNLIANAVRHTPSGRSVQVSAVREDDWATIRVTDQGPGIAPDDLQLVFKQYYSKSSNKDARSTGIGLSIAKEVVERMGGTIEAASILGDGTTMTVRLPLETDETVTGDKPQD